MATASGRMTAAEKRQRMNSKSVVEVIVAPPPLPSYTTSSGAKPRKRVSSQVNSHVSKKEQLLKKVKKKDCGLLGDHGVGGNAHEGGGMMDGAQGVINNGQVEQDGLTVHKNVHHGDSTTMTPSMAPSRDAVPIIDNGGTRDERGIIKANLAGNNTTAVHNPYSKGVTGMTSGGTNGVSTNGKDACRLHSIDTLEGNAVDTLSSAGAGAAADDNVKSLPTRLATGTKISTTSAATTNTTTSNKTSSNETAMPAEEEGMVLSLGIGKRTKKSSRSSGRNSSSNRRHATCATFSVQTPDPALQTAHGQNYDTGNDEIANSSNLEPLSIENDGTDDGTSHDLANTNNYEEQYNETAEEIPTKEDGITNYAEWYDPKEFAQMEKEAKKTKDTPQQYSLAKRGGRMQKVSNKSCASNVNDNFVRLDMRNSSGSCRGARNLKKVNKQKLWRSQHRFGMNDVDTQKGGGDGVGDGNGNNGGAAAEFNPFGVDTGQGSQQGAGQVGQQGSSRYNGGGGGGGYSKYNGKYNKKSTAAAKGGDLKCFASARSGGVDPLDDFMDGVFSNKEDADAATAATAATATVSSVNDGGKEKKQRAFPKSMTPTTTPKPTAAKAKPKQQERNSGVPLCTRHERPCKLLVVKRNNKGNKGRKFYVCQMPRGEQCDFFKWEEDTVEATQRALLKSSSNSGFIARQVAAARVRFKELTVPELRVEAKKRGLKPTGKKDQILTRILIWMRDEIANSVEGDDDKPNDENGSGKVSLTKSGSLPDGAQEGTPEEEEGISSSNGDTDLKSNDVHVDGTDGEDGNTVQDGCPNNDHSDDEKCNDGETESVTDNVTVTTKTDKTTKMIELSDSESSYHEDSSDSDESSCDDELEICHETTTKKKQPALAATKRNSAEPTTLHDSLTKYFNHTAFRSGQEWAIRRCLSHKKTLLVAPTGQGKSLCYALPAAIMSGICLVVSPLISLMQDQLRQLPPKIPAATLSGSMTQSQMALIVDDIMRGRYKVLFVSPERLASAAFRRLVRPRYDVETGRYERKFPTVSLLCVDEAHCLSQWGHNFRPSYLRVRSLLPLIQPKSILALTATAGPMVIRDICNTLCIPWDGTISGEEDSLPSPSPSPSVPIEVANTDDNTVTDSGGVKVLNCNRDNIDVFSLVLQSNDERRYLLHKILKPKNAEKQSERAKTKKLPIEEGCLSKGSVIIYVWRQKDTEIVAEQLNGAGVRGGVVCYHGGMDSNDRSKAQSKFLRGKVRICVATVAFGLGIDKPDIEGVIHLCLPPSPEHYLQEIGRAGRDGRAAKAIALPLEDEFVSRHSLAHSDRLSKDQLEIVFLALQKLVDDALGDIPPEAGIDLEADELFIDDVHVAMPVTQTVDASDCKEESIETIFSLLEGDATPSSDQSSLLSVEGYLPDAATITLKKRTMDKLEKMEALFDAISKCGIRVDGEQNEQQSNNQDTNTKNKSLNKYQGNFGGTAMEKGFYAYSFGTYKFSIVHCARCMGPQTEPRHVYAALRRLQGNGELELVLDTTVNGRAMHLKMKREGINLFRTKGGNNDSTIICPSVQEKTGIINDGVGAIVSKLSQQFSAKEKVSVGKVESMYEIMHQVSSCSQSDDDKEDGVSAEEEDGNNSDASCQAKKSPRLALFQKMVHDYFRNLPSTQEASNKAPEVIKNFPLRNKRLLSCLSSDVSSLMQVLANRRQEQMPMAVHINDRNFADYRDLCLAKILHSIDAPRAPILGWYSHPLWGKYRSYSFTSVVQAVKKTLNNA